MVEGEAEGEHQANRPVYDPDNPQILSREPPLRSTAPQSDYVLAQVGFGFLVLGIGLALTFGLALAMT